MNMVKNMHVNSCSNFVFLNWLTFVTFTLGGYVIQDPAVSPTKVVATRVTSHWTGNWIFLKNTSRNHCYTSLHAYFFTLLINKLQNIVIYSSRKFSSPSNERRILLLRLFLETQQLVEWHTPKVKVTKCYVMLHQIGLLRYVSIT